MIRPAFSDDPKDKNYLSEDEFAKMLEPFNERFSNYIKGELIYNYFADFIGVAYDEDCIWSDGRLEYEYKDAVATLQNTPKYEDLDINRLNEILSKKFGLKITEEYPIKIEKIQ